MKTTNTNAFLLIVTSSNIAQLPISWMLTWQRKAMTAGMRRSGKFWTPAMVCMLLGVLSGCKVTHSLEDMPQGELDAVGKGLIHKCDLEKIGGEEEPEWYNYLIPAAFVILRLLIFKR